MARILVTAFSSQTQASNLFSFFNDDSLRITSQTSRVIRSEGDDGLFFEYIGDFSNSNRFQWVLTSIRVGFGTTTVLLVDDFSINLSAFAFSSDPFGLITAGDDLTIANSDLDLQWSGNAGDDLFVLGTGDDTIFGGSGSDTLSVEDRFFDASAEYSFAGARLSTRDGGDSLLSVEFVQFTDHLAALTGGTNRSESLRGNQNSETSHDLIVGGAGNDTIAGLSGIDLLFGGDGSDVLDGGRGRDRLLGGADNDVLTGRGGRDELNGGSGHDRVSGGGGADRLVGESGRDRLFGNFGDDTLDGGTGRDRLYGGADNDLLSGGAHKDVLNGNSGDDTLFGGRGGDLLRGGSGNDELSGQGGNDTLIGQSGDDTISGGAGSDTFVFNRGNGRDVLLDFTVGKDVISISNGADDLDDITFVADGADVIMSFDNVEVRVEGISVLELQDADNFLF